MKSVMLNGKKIVPSKVICIGRNYVDHIAELGNEIPDEMVIFLKPNSAISCELISFHHEPLHYEGEICLMVIDGQFKAVGFGLDLTKRALQSQLKTSGLPWERAKSFDGSAVMSDFVSIDDINEHLSLSLSIDNVMIQQGGVDLMMYKPNEILENLKQHFTLEDGDIVMTGTPKGVGCINPASFYEGKIHAGADNNLIIKAMWQAK